jgi:hypothetical protein
MKKLVHLLLHKGYLSIKSDRKVPLQFYAHPLYALSSPREQKFATAQTAMKKPTQTSIIIANLRNRIHSECPARGSAPPLNQKVSFRSLPISELTLRGLEEGDKNNGNKHAGGKGGNNKTKKNASNKKQFLIMTDIQNACIPHALRGRDILGAARTGRCVVLFDWCTWMETKNWVYQ